ncbi:MAG: nickel pincer cofactor biosynthesis protein LarB [Ktedonobacteraceae bacterium]|nr:nickel pincer cofactor biosynthesis protein LarB [Ktedonobacteraceae bacterium]MBO0793965.1 nickel pincer cofactor biosynthesis protein LarB [Ktedonobacteraceae bacterium]
MNEKDQGQLDLLNQLLRDEQFAHGYGGGEQPERKDKGIPSSDPSQHLPQAHHLSGSSAIETRPDPGREQRKGAPEVIFGETKEVGQIIAMAQGLLAGSGRALISRIPPAALAPVQDAFRDYTVRIREAARSMVIYRPDYVRHTTGGHVGVISAGTSDIPVADEAALVVEEMGCRVTCIYDVGVAGLHRLLEPLRDLLADEVDAIIVAAGMDGALPSVVAGLVPVPVIGLPTSIGYGLGGKGIAALLSMLQTCAPGLSIVNIDNGVGAGITAGLIANRVAQAREHQSQ